MSETIVLDPNEETPDRFEFDITPYIGGAGPDFGEAAIEAFFADADIGQVPIAHTIPNRVVTLPLVLHGRDGLTFDQLRSILQAKVGIWQREGGVIKRETAIGPVYADIAEARLKFGGSTAQAMQDVDADAVLTLECIPDWYGDWIDLDAEGGTDEVIRVLTPERGDHPGRARIIVTELSGAAQRGCVWGIRSRHYDSAVTAALVYEAAALTVLDQAHVVGPLGDFSVSHSALRRGWTPVLLTDLDGVGPLTHTGSYRIWARCQTVSEVPPRVRLAWDVGDLTNPVPNTPVRLPSYNNVYDLDLGEVRLDPSPVGAHRWRGQLQAAGDEGGENIQVKRLWLQPLDEFAGTARALVNTTQGLTDYAAADEFNQSAGNLSGKTAAVGGTWATSGDAADFAVETTEHTARRSAVSDADITTGRYAVSGVSALTTQAVQVDFRFTGADVGSFFPNLSAFGVLARYVDDDNWVGAFLGQGGLNGASFCICTGGSVEALPIIAPTPPIPGAWQTIRLFADTTGLWSVWIFAQGGLEGDPVKSGHDSRLKTGGSHDSGKPGFYDANTLSTAITRNFDNFAVWVPEPDAVVHPSRSLELRTEGAFRENPDGGSAGPVSWTSGDFPRLPAAGCESRAVELLVKTSQGDFDELPDLAVDDLEVQVLYRPSYLYVPDGGPGS